MIQLYIYVFLLLSHLGYYRILLRVPCALQEVFVGDIQIFSLYYHPFIKEWDLWAEKVYFLHHALLLQTVQKG